MSGIYRGPNGSATADALNIDGDKGDLTVSNSGLEWTINTGVVDTSKLGGDITTAGKALLDDADASAQRATLGLGNSATATIGTDVLAFDSNLQDFLDTFTLPTTDSTNGFVLQTNGAGTLQLAAPSGIPDGDKGDITVSGSGTTWIIDNDIIDNANVNATAAIESSKLQFTAAGAGATARTVQSKLRDFASVKDFGAVGNGSTNDNVAIAAAIVALNAGTIKALYFPHGSYVVSTSFTITRNGASIYGDGARATIILQTQNVDTLIFTSTDPSNLDPNVGRIADITLRDIGIDYGFITAPSAGKALTLIRPTRSRFESLHIPNVYNGVDIQGGGGDIFFSNLSISGAYSWGAVANASWLMKFSIYANGVNEVPSEYFIDNFNIKGSLTPNYLQNAIIIEAGDGIWFSNGHCGFTDQNDLFINAQNNALATITDIKFVNVYFDGNFGGSTSGAGITISGSDTPVVEQITFIGCTSKIHAGHGVSISRGVTGLLFNGCQISYNGAYGAIIFGTGSRYHDGLVFKGNYFTANNNNDISADAVVLSHVINSVVSGNTIKGILAKPHSAGFRLGADISSVTITDNITKNCTTDYPAPLSNNAVTLTRNRKSGSDPSVVSSDGMVIPYGFDVVTVTGNTDFSNIGGIILPNRIVTLRFTGTPTCFDSAGNIKLNGNFVATSDSTLTLMCTDTQWTEVCRAVV